MASAKSPNRYEKSESPLARVTQNSSDLADGRDEMNLADQPIGVLDEKTAKTQKVRVLQIGTGTLTIEAGVHGLPTVEDEDVMLALLFLAKHRQDFSGERLTFTRGELLEVLRRGDRGFSYERIELSIKRLTGALLTYQDSWWDKKLGGRGNAMFHIVNAAWIFDPKDASQKNKPWSKCWVELGKPFLDSCQAGYIRKIDLELHFSLSSPVAKTLHRYLGKKFYFGPKVVVDLHELAKIVGLSETHFKDAGKLKEKLRKGIEELEEIGFLEKIQEGQSRHRNIARGVWEVVFKRGKAWRGREKDQKDFLERGKTEPGENREEESRREESPKRRTRKSSSSNGASSFPNENQIPLLHPHPNSFSSSSPNKNETPLPYPNERRPAPGAAARTSEVTVETTRTIVATGPPTPTPTLAIQSLTDRGVARKKAEQVAAKHAEAYLQEKVAIFDWLKTQDAKLVGTNPTGWLIASIEGDYAAPAEYVKIQEHRRRRAAEDQEQTRQQLQRRRELEASDRLKDENAELDRKIAAMSLEQRQRLHKDALRNAEASARTTYQKLGEGPAKEALFRSMARDELRRRREG